MFIIVCRRNMEAVVDFLMRDDKHKILFFWVSIIKHEAYLSQAPSPQASFCIYYCYHYYEVFFNWLNL